MERALPRRLSLHGLALLSVRAFYYYRDDASIDRAVAAPLCALCDSRRLLRDACLPLATVAAAGAFQ
jgi:hypothetical protein